MAQVKPDISKKTDPEKIQFARQIVTDMTSNPNFPTPTPALPGVTAAATTLETAYNASQTARQLAKSKTQAQESASAALVIIVSQLANYVQNTSNGDAAKITSSGFPVRNRSTPIGDLPAPGDFRALETDAEGTIDLKWNHVRGSKSYVVERAPDAIQPLVYEPIASPTKAKQRVNGMVSGQRYWFRVAAVGAAGTSAWSNAINKIAP